MTDLQIIQGLIDRDEQITREFFFLRCQPLVYSLIQKFFGGDADYDELVNDLYLHLMEDDARRLRMFKGNSSIYFWLKEVAKNYFLDRKNRACLIENVDNERLIDKAKNEVTDNSVNEAMMDVAVLLDQIENESYRLVLQKHIIEGMDYDELEKVTGIKKANLYNIKKRAMAALEKVARIARMRGDALCALRCEEYILHHFGIHKTLEELRQLASYNGWLSEEGVLAETLGNVAKEYGLKVEKSLGRMLQVIMKALDEGNQVMAAVDGGELIGDPLEERLEDILVGGIVDHCVVVLSVSIENDEVSLYDPAFGVIPLAVSIAHFMDAWKDSDYYCVIISR